MESARVHHKIKLLFEKLSEPDYVMNNYYMDSLINKLSDSKDADAANLLESSLLPDLLVDALQDTSKYHNTVNVFLGRILAIVCRNEHYFTTKILEKRRDKLLDFLSNITAKNMNPSLKVAYMELAMTLVSHKAGVSWMIETELWKKIISLHQNSTTVFVLRLVYKFIAEFVWKLNDFEEHKSLDDVLLLILQPLLEVNLEYNVTITAEEEQETCKKFEPILQMMLSICNQGDRLCYDSKVVRFLSKEHNVSSYVYLLFDRIRREDVILLLSKVLIYLIFIKTFQAKPCKPGVEYTPEDFVELLVVYFNTIHFQIQRRNPILVFDYCGSCNAIWKSLCQNLTVVPSQVSGIDLQPQVRVLMIYLVPVLVYTKNALAANSVAYSYLSQYMTTFINMACEHTARAIYALRDLIMEQDVLDVTLQSVKRLTCMRDQLNDVQANMVFGALFFALCAYDPTDTGLNSAEKEEDYEDSQQKVLVMTYIVDTLLWLVKNYNINWHESLEVICLNTVLHNILTRKPNLTCKFVVSALNLLTVTVTKFLPPNLSLLMEATPGSAMYEIGTLIFTKMHDMNWEVRDSALELLTVCTEISYIKYPPIQKPILEKKLISVAMTMALNDREPYAQVSALRCVGAASRVQPMWEQMKADHPNLIEKFIKLLRHNQEGIVRKEACNVLCEVYQSVKVSLATKQMLYDHMASSGMSDFHWEVQISALKFWRIVIQSLLNDQGMLDGTFPPVTFSRVTRKIVNLNEAEVRKRLIIVLEELASIGCLTVLVKLLYDDTEVQVMESAYSVARDFHNILLQYKVSEDVAPVEGEPTTIEELKCHIKENDEELNGHDMEPESSNKSNNVIESIIKTDDMSLLSSIYQKGMSLENEETLAPKLKLVKKASPYLFVNFLENTDCKKMIDNKRNWKEGIRSISSLLDDVLGLYETDDDFNSLDCY